MFAARQALAYEPLAQALGTPFVVKPTRGSGSVGVVVVRTADDLRREVTGCADDPPGPVIAQRHVPGVDIDVDLVAVRGRLQALAVHRVQGHTMRFVRHPALGALAGQAPAMGRRALRRSATAAARLLHIAGAHPAAR